MSAKDIEDLKQKVFYMDRRVNPYFNHQISGLIKMIYELDNRIKVLEKRNNVENAEETKNVEKKSKVPAKKNTAKNNQNNQNDIRTITID
tara:strand:- start:2541 stop:2810 length:270 start_codon:yes stop_codon:yes gene_type:complete